MSDARHHPAKPNQLRLKIRFDADQETDQLSFKLRQLSDDSEETDITPSPNPRRGTNADSLYFNPGDELHVQIVGGGEHNRRTNTGFQSFQILQCALISRPQVSVRGHGVRTQWSPPSPFTQSSCAISPLSLDFAPHVVSDEEDYLKVALDWKHTLNVGLTHGMWELSFYLTVKISRADSAEDQIRVLIFDPEAEVGGTGTLPTEDD
ncbi:MAG: hypothetical protein ABW202_10285 [Duganella sp.]